MDNDTFTLTLRWQHNPAFDAWTTDTGCAEYEITQSWTGDYLVNVHLLIPATMEEPCDYRKVVSDKRFPTLAAAQRWCLLMEVREVASDEIAEVLCEV